MQQSTPVYLYWPNIIDYGRIVLFVLFLLVAMHHAVLATILISIIALADAVDGWLARTLNQQSHLGTALDFTIDRVVTASLCMILGLLLPRYWLFFCVLLVLDAGSHFMHLYRAAILGDGHHKHSLPIKSRLVHLYYNNRGVLFALCFCHDAWLISLFLYQSYPKLWLFIALIGFLPGFVIKTALHGLQFFAACKAFCQNEPNVS